MNIIEVINKKKSNAYIKGTICNFAMIFNILFYFYYVAANIEHNVVVFTTINILWVLWLMFSNYDKSFSSENKKYHFFFRLGLLLCFGFAFAPLTNLGYLFFVLLPFLYVLACSVVSMSETYQFFLKKANQHYEKIYDLHFTSSQTLSSDEKVFFIESLVLNSNNEAVKKEINLINELIASGLKYHVDSTKLSFLEDKVIKEICLSKLNDLENLLKSSISVDEIQTSLNKLEKFVKINQKFLYENQFEFKKLNNLIEEENNLLQEIKNLKQYDETSVNQIENKVNDLINQKNTLKQQIDIETQKLENQVRESIMNKYHD